MPRDGETFYPKTCALSIHCFVEVVKDPCPETVSLLQGNTSIISFVNVVAHLKLQA